MRKNTSRYISSRTNRRVGRISRIVFSPDVLQGSSAVVENPTHIEDSNLNQPEQKVEVVPEVKEEPVAVEKVEEVKPVEIVVEEPEETAIPVAEPESEEEQVEEPEKKESAYAKRKKAKQENNK